ncbi:MAG: stage II sporulation protein R [Oscillospiraceae bacterium]|nr:stage II sporulation protein R [Oscillospiraceae bacterium]
MRKIAKLLLTSLLLLAILWAVDVYHDRQTLSNNLIRLHVVANSDSREDQTVKLLVRDAVTQYVNENLSDITDKDVAMTFLQQHIPELTETANQALAEVGSSHRAEITLTREAFPKREYDTFSLPAGVYESLRIRIGDAEGKNWWCVVFPSLCFQAVGEDFTDTAAGAGFDEPLTGALEGEKPYQVRFFLLDCLGWLQNFFHQL